MRYTLALVHNSFDIGLLEKVRNEPILEIPMASPYMQRIARKSIVYCSERTFVETRS